jgi:putative sigma-54 modulation protein
MKHLKIHISPHDLKLSPALLQFIHDKLSAVSRFAEDIIAAEIVLRGPSGASGFYSVSARLALPGRDVQGVASHSNLYGAINRLVARLGRLARKRKTRRVNASHGGDKKRTSFRSESTASAFAP